MHYPDEILPADDDDGTMVESLHRLEAAVIGRSIARADRTDRGLMLTLDDGTAVILSDSSDCCAYTTIDKFLLDPGSVAHMIMGVGTTESFTKWHIYADWGDILALDVEWSCGNPFYYGYGFTIEVMQIQPDTEVAR